VFVDDQLVIGGGGVSARRRFLQTIIQQLSGGNLKGVSQTAKIHDLRAIVSTACPSSVKTYIIIDGLDRCPTESRHELEDEITILVHYGCYVMVTNYLGLPTANIVDHTCGSCQFENFDHYWCCRDCDHKICDDCADEKDCTTAGHTVRRHAEADLALVPSDEDIQMFIDHELSLRMEHRDYDDELHELLQTQRERVEDVLCRKSSRTLVVCKALLGYLRDFQKAGYDEVMHLQTGVLRPEEEVFNVLMSKVKHESPETVEIALLAFSLVSQIPSGSTMTFEDLTNALRRLRPVIFIDEQDLYAICQGMLVIRDRRTVGPFHDDFGVYLQENCAEEFRHLGVDLTVMTTDILLDLPDVDSWTTETHQRLSNTLSEHPFLGYAAPNWGLHLRQSTAYRDFDERQSPTAGSLIEKALSLLRSSSKLATCLYVANIYDRTFYLWPGCHALHFCAYYGLAKFIHYFTSGIQSSIDARDPVYGRTPLMVAASKGQTEFAQRMIELGADVSLECEDGRSTLVDAVEHDAANQGYYNITKLILQHTPPKTHTRAFETTPLIACIRESEHRLFNPQLLNLLLQHPSIDVNEVTLQGHTALLKAVVTEGIAVETIDLLLQHHDLRLGAQDRAGKTALHLAAQFPGDDTSVIRRILLSKHCTPDVANTRDSCGMTAAMLLLQNEDIDREEMVDILHDMSKAGADFHCIDNNGRGLLHAAVAGEQDLAVVHLNLEKRLPLDTPDRFGWCAVHYACSIRAHDTLCRLLELGASSTRGDVRGWPPLEILRCDDPEDDTVQRMCSVLESSSLRESPSANVPAILRPAWTFATCKLSEFKQMIPEDVRDWWLPDPRRGNLVSMTPANTREPLTSLGIPLCR
jgi:ankyrin repeat protein